MGWVYICHSELKIAGGLCTELNLSFKRQGGISLGFEAEHPNKKHHNPLPRLVHSQKWLKRRCSMPTATCTGLY